MAHKTTSERLNSLSTSFEKLEEDLCRDKPQTSNQCGGYSSSLRNICEKAGEAFFRLPEEVLRRLALPDKFISLPEQKLVALPLDKEAELDMPRYDDWWLYAIVQLEQGIDSITITNSGLRFLQHRLPKQWNVREQDPLDMSTRYMWQADRHYMLDVCRVSMQACDYLEGMTVASSTGDADVAAEADDDAPAQAESETEPQLRIRLDSERDRIRIDSTWYDLTGSAELMLRKLIEARGVWVGGKNIQGRPDHIVKRMNKSVAAIIDSDKAKGYRINPSHFPAPSADT